MSPPSLAAADPRLRWGCEAADAIAAGLVVFSEAGEICFANRWAEQLTGRSGPALTELNLRALFDPAQTLLDTLPGLTPEAETVVRSRVVGPGVDREVRVWLTRIDSASEPGPCVALFRDAEGSDASLETSPGEWSSALAKVVAGFSHAMCNPLAAIHGLVDLWADGASATGPEAEIAARIRTQIRRLERLVRSLSSLDRTVAVAIEAHTVSELLTAAHDRLRAAGIDLPLSPELLAEAAALEVAVDLTLAATVLEELWRNATEAVPATGPPSLRLAHAGDDAHGAHAVRLEVVDHGPGIAARHFSRIFDPFFTTKGQRPGIGLTIARVYCRQMDGRITVQSNPHAETVFGLSLRKAER